MAAALGNKPGIRVSLAFLDLSDLPEDLRGSYGHSIVELDLSHNNISDLKFLSELPRLQSLVLDSNQITSHVKIPVSHNLRTLWLNHNEITNLGLFINTLASSCPNLRILSMMNNEAAPSFFNGGTYEQFQDYRHFVISNLPKLEVLDYSRVSAEERQEAKRLYPTIIPLGRPSRNKPKLK